MTKKHRSDDSFTISKVTLWQLATLIFVVLFVISLLTGGFGGALSEKTMKAAAPSAKAPAAKAPSNNNAPTVEVNLEGTHMLGDEDAPVTIVEWSDFQCPFCGKFYSESEKRIIEEYVNTGKVKLAYKQFPLDSLHPQATPAAVASECAAEQGKFWEYHDLIFENQRSISDANLKKWAGDLGLNQAQFDDCLDSNKYLDKVKADLAEGQAAGIRGTPGFIINGKLISGAQPFSVFQSAIEAELN